MYSTPILWAHMNLQVERQELPFAPKVVSERTLERGIQLRFHGKYLIKTLPEGVHVIVLVNRVGL